MTKRIARKTAKRFVLRVGLRADLVKGFVDISGMTDKKMRNYSQVQHLKRLFDTEMEYGFNTLYFD
jgi:hypothetical protein